jgi:glycosyltransferase involved in cell wall biosynthesis
MYLRYFSSFLESEGIHMNKSRNVALFFPDLNKIHIYKDVIQLPYFLSKEYGAKVSIYYYRNKENEDLPYFYKNMELVGIAREANNSKKASSLSRALSYFTSPFLNVIRKKAKEMDILMLYHFGFDKYSIINTYKKYNNKGKVYLKLDANVSHIKNYSYYFLNKNLKSRILRKLVIKMIDQTTLFSCETNRILELLKESPLWRFLKGKITVSPNGFDSSEITENQIRVKSFREKANLFCVVGRLSAPEKNTRMVLEAVKNIDLRDWKLYLVGPIDKNSDFERYLVGYLKNINRKNIIQIGNISDRRKLLELYNNTKCLILSSISESFGIVLLEAAFLGNYIISTRVGAAMDITNGGEMGSIIETGDVENLTRSIKQVINQEIDLETNSSALSARVKREFTWQKIVKDKAYFDLFHKE